MTPQGEGSSCSLSYILVPHGLAGAGCDPYLNPSQLELTLLNLLTETLL